MSNDDRGAHLPPSTARLAAAARAGQFPRSPFLAFGAGLAAFGLVAWGAGRAIVAALSDLVAGGLDAALFHRADPAAAIGGALAKGALVALPLVLAPATAALVVSLAPALVARRFGRGSTSVPLPEPKDAPTGRAVLAGFGSAATALIIIRGLRAAAPAVSRFSSGDPGASRAIAETAATSALAVGIVLVLLGLSDLALDRVRLFEALKLNRSEARREDRAATSARRARAAIAAESRRGGAPP